MLIIEGPDLVGKTTLISALVEHLNRCRKRFKTNPGDILVDRFGLAEVDDMEDQVQARARRWCIFDRCYPSEIIYGLRCREQSNISPMAVIRMNHMLAQKHGMVVIIYADEDAYERLIDLHHSRGENFNPEQCRRVNAAYRQLAKTGSIDDYVVGVADSFCVEINFDGALGTLMYPAKTAAFVKRIVETYTNRQLAYEK